MEIAVLADNLSLPGFGQEHGLSLALTPDNGELWLWDTGASPLFLDTANKLGVDISRAKGLALSHGHYDHAGGISHLLDIGFSGPIFAHPGYASPRFSVSRGEKTRSIGMEKTSAPLPLPGIVEVSSRQELAPGLTMLADIPRLPGCPQYTDDFYFDAQAEKPDPVADDSCLLLESAKGPVLILGCCHSGLANTLAHVREAMGVTSLHAVVGGLHLMDVGERDFSEAASLLEDCGAQRIHAGHCTGNAALGYLQKRLGRRFAPLGTGQRLVF
ncbi:MAG: MBL fold metallo-hydrolase [Desulfovibrio sp.]|nr:MAG: MBL fold metallo-hydrolase [Desulfovibrio sp.]